VPPVSGNADKLADGQAHIWYARPEEVVRRGLVSRYESLLAPEEQARKQRFRFEESRLEYLVTRVLVRTVLSHYTGVVPEAWRFDRQPLGPPIVVHPDFPAVPRFNLSHTSGLIACLVAGDRDVGVDVENTTRTIGYLAIAERYFSPREVEDIRSLPEPAGRRRFFEYWTLKESLIKAMGTRISSGLSRFVFEPGADPVAVTFDESVSEDPAGWQFALHEIGPEHVLAASLRCMDGTSAQLELRETIPLVS